MKRKDKYGRILYAGESQLKNGAYTYRKTKNGKKIIDIYASTLSALRAKEKELQLEAAKGVDIVGARGLTINDAYNRYCKNRTDIRKATASRWDSIYRNHIKNDIGKCIMKDVRYSDVVAFYMDILTRKNLSAGMVDNIHCLLSILYKSALRDRLVIYNPVCGANTEAKKKAHKKPKKRHPLTEAEQTAFTNYIMNHHKYDFWTPLIIFLLGTGCRIGEAGALTWADVSFSNEEISITKTLGTLSGKRYINPTKTESGCRVIPMFDAVKRALIARRKYQLKNGASGFVIDGYSNFVFTSQKNTPLYPSKFDDHLKTIVKNYNREERRTAEKERRAPLYLPHITAHIFRHTFASRLCEHETDLKLIQSIMGHTNISTTLNIYTEVSNERKHKKFKALDGKIQIV